MPKKDPKLAVQIPRPADEQPAWSRVGIVGVAGFVLGIAWPRLAGVQIGPSVPGDYHAADVGSAQPSAAAAPPSSGPAPSSDASGAASAEPSPANRESVTIGAGRIVKCSDKGKKVDECGKLQFDPIALPKLKELEKCPATLGLSGKVGVGFDIDFEKKEVHVTKGKKTSVPASTVQGILQCAARDFANISLEEVPHKFRKYTVMYALTFYPPGKGPDAEKADKDKGDKGDKAEGDEDSAGATTSESEASGTAIVSWDTALLRKDPKDGDVVARIVRGTKVKIVGRQNDWYKIESGSKNGWVYRGAIGL